MGQIPTLGTCAKRQRKEGIGHGGKWCILQLVQDTETLRKSEMCRKDKWDQDIRPLATVFENENELLKSFNRNVKDLLKRYLAGQYILFGKVFM